MDNNGLSTNLASLGTDCISRQAAIDALCNDYCGGHQDCKFYPNCENLRSVQKLPSAQPEIVRCEECLYRKVCSWEKQGAKFCSFAERREVTDS